MSRFLSIGEVMVELSAADSPGLLRQGYAGDTFNTAWYARAMLPDSWQVAYYTRLGSDPFSARILELMAAHGIASDHVRCVPGLTVGLYAVTLQAGERSFDYWRGQSAARGLAQDPARLAAALAGADLIYLSGITLAILPPEDRGTLLAALQVAKDRGAVIAFDPNLRPRLWESRAVMCATVTDAARLAAVLLPSFEEDALYFGDASVTAAAARWRALGPGQVVVKNGGGTMAIAGPTGIETLSLPRAPARDTTAAGDSFNAAWLAAWMQGASGVAAAHAGHALACQVIAWPGALVPMAQLQPIGAAPGAR